MRRGREVAARVDPHPLGAPPTVSANVRRAAFAHLPEEITLTRDELAVVLFALDVVEDAAVGLAGQAKVRRAIRLLTAKLWPELGDLLGDDQE